MTEPGPVLDAVQTAIDDLAVVLAAIQLGLNGECVRAGRQLEMGELDLLSARNAVAKACLEIDVAGPMLTRVRVAVPTRVGSAVLRSAAQPGVAEDVTSGSPDRRRAGRRRRELPGPDQGELFAVYDVTLRAV